MESIWHSKLLRTTLRWSVFLSCFLLIHPAFGGRLPEGRQADAPLHAPARPAGTAAQAVPDTAGTNVATQVAVDTQIQANAEQANAETAATKAGQARLDRISGAFEQYFHWVLWPLVGLVLLVAGLSGRAHVRAQAVGEHAYKHKRRLRPERPRKLWYLPDWMIVTLAILALLSLVALGVFLGGLVLGTLTTAFGLTVIALVVPIALVAGVVLLFGNKILEAIDMSRNNRGRGMRGCVKGILFWIFMVFVAAPIVLGVTMLLMGLAILILLGGSVLYGLIGIAALIMIACTVLGLLSFFGILDEI